MYSPLYQQIYLALHQRIIDGVYPFGSVLPSEQSLIDEFHVSRITVRHALEALSAAGIIRRRRGTRTVVVYRPPISPIRVSVFGLIDDVLKIGMHTDIALHSSRYVPANRAVAAALEIPVGMTVLHVVRTRTKDGKPFSHVTTFLPESLGRRFSQSDLQTVPMLELLRRAGADIFEAEQTVCATLADPEIAGQLNVEMGSPLLRISRVVRGQDRVPVQFITCLYPPDRYEYRMSLSTEESSAGPYQGPSRRRALRLAARQDYSAAADFRPSTAR